VLKAKEEEILRDGTRAGLTGVGDRRGSADAAASDRGRLRRGRARTYVAIIPD